jgi:hypothetical protein
MSTHLTERTGLVAAAATVIVAALLPSVASADPRCARFGRVEYTATRTVEGRSSKIFVSGRNLREERPAPDGTTDVILVTGGRAVIFNPVRKFGARLPSVRPPRIPADARRVRTEGETIIVEVRDDQGAFREVERATCRSDGALLTVTGLAGGQGGPRRVTTTNSNIVVGRLDPALFRVPADVRIGRPPRPGVQPQ